MRYLYSSIPVIAGIWTSAIRQAASTSRGDARKSAAHEKASTLWPSDFISLLMESQKNRSSSTTETREAFGIRTPTISLSPVRRLQHVVALGCKCRNLRQRLPLGQWHQQVHFGLSHAQFVPSAQGMPPMWVGVNFGLYRLRPSAPNRAVQAHSVGIGYDVLRAWHPT